MPEEENIEVVHSEETGNEPIEAPSETPEIEEPVVEPVVEAPLYELPDGRKVDAATLQTEWKENFLPEFTRKSQALAEIERSKAPVEPAVNPYADPDYTPGSYAEIIEAAKQAALAELASKEQARIAEQQAVEGAVVQQLEAVKAIDPNVNENQLFLHANKYGFRDLSTAYKNMKDMSELTKNVQKVTAQNIAKRNDPVSVSTGAGVSRPDPSAFGSAIEYMRSLQ